MAEFSFIEDDNTKETQKIFSNDEKSIDSLITALEQEGIIIPAKELEPQKIKASAKIKEIDIGYFRCQITIDESDFSVTIWPKTDNLIQINQIKNNQNKIIIEMIKDLQTFIPEYLRVNIFPPAKEFDVACFTVKVIGAADALGVNISEWEKSIPEALSKAFHRAIAK